MWLAPTSEDPKPPSYHWPLERYADADRDLKGATDTQQVHKVAIPRTRVCETGRLREFPVAGVVRGPSRLAGAGVCVCLIVNRCGLFESEPQWWDCIKVGRPLCGGMMLCSKDCLAGVYEQRRTGYSYVGCMGLVLVKDCCALQLRYLVVAAFPWFCFLCLCLPVLVMCLTSLTM